MANKPEFVDLVSDRTRQNYRRPAAVKRAVAVDTEAVEEKRLSNWPPERMEQWRLVNLTPQRACGR